MLAVTLFLLETAQGRKGARRGVCIRPKAGEKRAETMSVAFAPRRLVFHLRVKKKRIKVIPGPCFFSGRRADKLTLLLIPGPRGSG